MRYFFISHQQNGSKKLLPPTFGYNPNSVNISVSELKKVYENYNVGNIEVKHFNTKKHAEQYVER